MPLITFACPACRKVLKSALPIAAGTPLRCPTCGASFAMTDLPSDPAAAPPGEATAGLPKGSGRRARRALLAATAALFAVAGLAAGAYFLFFGGAAPPEEDPLAYLPAGTEFVAGADFPTLLDDPLLGPALERAVRQEAGAGEFLDRCRDETGLEPRELLGHALLAGKLDVLDQALGRLLGPLRRGIGQPVAVTLILKTSRPFDPEQVVRAAGRAIPRKAHGKTYYEVNVGQMRTLFMPSDRLIVLSALPAADLDAMFGSDGTRPNLSADGLALVRGVEAHPFWTAVPFEGAARARLDDALRDKDGERADRVLLTSLKGAKGLAVWAGPDGERLRFGAEAPCADEDAAAGLAVVAEATWKTKKTGLSAIALPLALFRPKMAQALAELTDGLKFKTEGKTARLTGGVSRPSLADAWDEFRQDGLPGDFQPLVLPSFRPKPGGGTGKKR
jgi:hypothetical protein